MQPYITRSQSSTKQLRNQPFVKQALFFSIYLLVFSCVNLLAQQPPVAEINNTFSGKGIYRFPSFNTGMVVFKDGGITSARLNYNISTDEIHFINNKGDTLSLADPATVNYISLNEIRFYYEQRNGYLQVIDTTGKMILAFKQSFSGEQERENSFGAITSRVSVSANSTNSYFTANGEQYKLNGNEKVTINTRESYFLGDAHKHFSKAGKEFILDHYPKNHPEIKSFIKTNHINFNNADDIMKLLQYCSKLSV